MSNFPFVDDRILQNNLDLAFVHVVDLLALSESQSYENKKTLVSSLRKTIIIRKKTNTTRIHGLCPRKF